MHRILLLLLLAVGLGTHAQQPPSSAYRFSYTIDTLAGKRGYIRVRFALHNNSGQVLYFLRRSCSFANGLQWTARSWQHSPRIVCRASFPVVDTVEPGGAYNWTTYFSGPARGAMPEFSYRLLRLKERASPGQWPNAAQLPAHDTITLCVPVGSNRPHSFIRANALRPTALMGRSDYAAVLFVCKVTAAELLCRVGK